MSTSVGLRPYPFQIALALMAFQLSWQAQAQTPATPPTAATQVSPSGSGNNSVSFKQALEVAWALDASSKTLSSKQAELAARQRAVSSWMAGDPSITLAHRTDRLNANGGLREYEAEISAPLWSRSTQSATRQALQAQEQLLVPATLAAKNKLALTLLALAADHAFSDLEHTLAQRKTAESEQLARDTERRLRAGDVARLDSLQAQSAVLQAKNQVTTALANKQRLQTQWQSLTGIAAVSDLPASGTPSGVKMDAEHPAAISARAQLQVNTAKLRLAEADRRDPMELALGLSRDRSAFGAAAESNLRIALRIPLGGENRNQPRITAARIDVEQAQADLDTTLRTTQQDIAAAQAALQSAQVSQQGLQERAALATQMQTLIAQAYRLGERDLPARLRADSEKNEADLAAQRAQIELRRAAAHLELTLDQLQ